MSEDIQIQASSDLTESWQQSIAVKITAIVMWVVMLAVFTAAAFYLSGNLRERLSNELSHHADSIAFQLYQETRNGHENNSGDNFFAGSIRNILNNILAEGDFTTIIYRQGDLKLTIGDASAIGDVIVREFGMAADVNGFVRIEAYHPFINDIVISRRTEVVGIVFLALIPFGGLLIWTIRANVHTPFQLLVRAIRTVHEGDWDAHIDTSRSDEFGDLSKLFNRMIDKVKEQQLALESQLELEKTANEALLASKTKSAFLANMSHEIRTPLTAVIGYADAMLMDDLSEDERKDATQTIVQSGKHLLSVINDILDLSKIEADKLQLELIDTDLFQLSNDVDALLRTQAEKKGLVFNINYHYPLPHTIKTDPTRLRQILINIVNNAIKFTSNGIVDINICFAKGEQQDKLIFKIVDSGIGMSATQCSKLFQPFSQADDSTTRKFGGSGLGLSISHSLSRMLGGDIIVESIEGKGSVFTVTIAMDKIASDALVQQAPTRLLKDDAKKHNAVTEISMKGHVLLVDDVKENRAIISALLKKAGLSYDIAKNGQDAVDMASNASYDLILMDIQMPIMDGIQATQIIRQHDTTTPIVAITANAMQSDLDLYQKSRFNSHIAKPILRDVFFNTLTEYLNQDFSIIANTDVTGPMSTSVPQLRGTVLVAEDNPANQRLITMMMEKTGAIVTIVDNGHAAVDIASAQIFDLILMDLNMPGINGDEAAELLRAAGNKQPIYMLTAETDADILQHCSDIGTNGKIEKPILLDALYGVLSRHLQPADTT